MQQADKKLEKEIEHKIETWVEKKFGGDAEIFAEVLSIVFTFIMLWAAHYVLSWQLPFFAFILPQFNSILWAIDLALGSSILAKILRLSQRDKITKHSTQILENCFNFLLIVVILTFFPYDFQKLIAISWINTAFKIILIISLFGLLVATITEFVKLISPATRKQSTRD